MAAFSSACATTAAAWPRQWVTVRCPRECAPLTQRAGGGWDPGARQWLIEPARIAPVLRVLRGETERARSIKSAEEILCMNYSLAVADIAVARMRETLRPGLTENELFAILYHTNIAICGEWIDARMLTSGDGKNPWLQESSERRIRPGELVAFDADMVGPFGYCADVSSTFFCGPGRPTTRNATSTSSPIRRFSTTCRL